MKECFVCDLRCRENTIENDKPQKSFIAADLSIKLSIRVAITLFCFYLLVGWLVDCNHGDHRSAPYRGSSWTERIKRVAEGAD